MPDADCPAPDAASGAAAVTLIPVKNGTAKSRRKISSAEGGFTGILHGVDLFGSSVASPRDLDGGGIPCQPCDMNCDGTVDASDIEFFIDILFNGASRRGSCSGDSEGFIECLFQ